MKKLLFFALFLAVGFGVFAQEPVRNKVDDEEKKALLKQIKEQKKAFVCNFVEEKWIAVLDETKISKGTISYEPSKRLTCEYTEPELLMLCKEADGNLTVTKKGKPAKANIMHRQMMDMMEVFVSGKAVENSDEYNVDVWSDIQDYIISLTPKTKQRFCLIELYLGKDSKRIETTVLKEAKGDSTVVTMMEP